MNINKTRKLVQGAMIAGIFGMLSLLNTYTGGMFDIFICYGMVSPIVWYGVNYSLKENMIVVIVSMFVIMMMGTPFFVISALASCVSGLVIGECLKKKAKKAIIMLGVFVVCLINNLLIYEVFNALLGIDLVGELTLMHQQLSTIIPYVSIDLLISFIPIVLVIMSAMEMYIIIIINQLILKRLKIDFPSQFHISTMHLSKKAGIALLLSCVIGYVLYYVMHMEYAVVLYIFVLSFLTLILQGFAFLQFYTIVTRKKIMYMLSVLGFFIPFMYPVFFVFGVIDIFSDLRRNILYNEVSCKE